MLKIYLNLLLFLPFLSFAQATSERRVLDDGTLVKKKEGNIELQFPSGKKISTVRISKSGEIVTEYQEDSNTKPASQTNDSTKSLPGLDVFSASPGNMDNASQASYNRARAQYFEYFRQGYQHRQRVFQWQLASSKYIFIIVSLLVLSGIVFAAIQFYIGLKKVERISALKPGSGSLYVEGTEPVTTFEAGSTGIKISSPVLGLIILVISLAFFYLYLVYIYPIEEIF